MKKSVVLLLPLAFAVSPAHARNHDGSTAGNANKAACKGSAAMPALVAFLTYRKLAARLGLP